MLSFAWLPFTSSFFKNILQNKMQKVKLSTLGFCGTDYCSTSSLAQTIHTSQFCVQLVSL
jgi:hypothetical protein